MGEPRPPCPGDRGLAADLALGLLTGAERAAALEHVAACARCAALVGELGAVADSLLLAAPEAEPPPGFESAVVARVARGPRRWPPRLLALAAAVALVLAGFAGGTLLDGRRSEATASAAMTTPAGRRVGVVWRHDGEPSWLFVSVPAWSRWESPTGEPVRYRLRVELADGHRVEVRDVRLDEGGGSWGTTTTVDVTAIRAVSIVDDTGRVWCTGRFA